ncbi:hypothetical protein [Nocardioides sp.]|uniref:hypothetical protein n=1 Tax=Nocardioides sp. TaxID=35761 RepID=UPI0035283A2E
MTARRTLLQISLVVLLALGAGLAGAWVWESRWTPVTGVALHHEFVLDQQGAPADFTATGSYVVWALVFGLLAGLLAGVVTRGRELTTLVVLLVSAGVGGWLMVQVGQALGPPDPAALAKTLDDFTPMTADLRVHGVAPLLALPAGALLGLAVAYLTEVAFRGVRQPPAPRPATLVTH